MSVDKKAIISAIEEARKKSRKKNFQQSVDLVVNLRDIDLKKPENRVNLLIELPNPVPKKVRICMFATGDLALRAKKAGIDAVFDKDSLEKLAADKKMAKKVGKTFDFFIAEASLMPLIGKTLGQILGPRGKMPTPVPPTASVENIMNRYQGMINVRIKDQLNAQCRIGTEDMSSEKIAENIQTVLAKLGEKMPKGLKNIRSVCVKTTMGPLVKIKP